MPPEFQIFLLRWVNGHGVVLGPFETASARFWCCPSPLLKEKVNAPPFTEIPDVENPSLFHGAGIRSALPTNNDPGYPLEIEFSHRAEKRLNGKKTDLYRRHLKMPNSGGRQMIFDGNTAPDMPRRNALAVSALQVILHQCAPLREHLEYMPIGRLHGVEDLVDEHRRYIFVKQVAH